MRTTKAKSMTAAQRRSAVKRKRAAGNPDKPTNVKTFAKDGKLIRKYHKGCGKAMSNRRKKTRYS